VCLCKCVCVCVWSVIVVSCMCYLLHSLCPKLILLYVFFVTLYGITRFILFFITNKNTISFYITNIVYKISSPLSSSYCLLETDDSDIKIADFGFAKKACSLLPNESACGTPG
jgi:hypothetical protein